MISNKTLASLVNNLDKVVQLMKDHQLEEVSLLQPRYKEGLRLCFVISRKDTIFTAEAVNIDEKFYEILGLDYADKDCVNIQVREEFNPGYFDEIYNEAFSITKDASREELVLFIQEKLKFKYSSTTQEEQFAAPPESTTGSPQNIRKRHDAPVTVNPPSAKKLASSSTETTSPRLANSSFAFLSASRSDAVPPHINKHTPTPRREEIMASLSNAFESDDDLAVAVEEMIEKRHNTTASQKICEISSA